MLDGGRRTSSWKTSSCKKSLAISQGEWPSNVRDRGRFGRIVQAEFYLTTERARASFNLAYIGDDFQAEHKEEFDQSFMRALYRYAYDKAAKGYPWQHAPPGFAAKAN